MEESYPSHGHNNSLCSFHIEEDHYDRDFGPFHATILEEYPANIALDVNDVGSTEGATIYVQLDSTGTCGWITSVDNEKLPNRRRKTPI